MHPEFWQGKSVFITGHTGFKGGWLSLWLQMLGARVTGYALAPTAEQTFFTSASIANGMTSIIGDVRSPDTLHRTLADASPDIVIHLAAQPLVRESYQHPTETYATNVMGTVNLLDAIRRHGSGHATMIVTSDKCYENDFRSTPYRETDLLGGHDPYSNSKACAELVTQAYAASYFSTTPSLGRLATGRAGNVIGGGDWARDRLIPDIVRAIQQGEPPVLRYPHAIRPWQHVLEPLSGYLAAIEYLYDSSGHHVETWNFGSRENSPSTVGVIAKRFCELWGTDLTPILATDASALHEADYLTLDTLKASRELQWSQRWDIDTSLQHTVDWYRAFYEGKDMRAITCAQIEAYEKQKPAERKSYVSARS